MPHVTLDRLDQKLDDLIERMKESTRVMDAHIHEDRAMYIKIDRLDQNEQRRQWHLRTLWTAVLSSMAAIGLLFFK